MLATPASRGGLASLGKVWVDEQVWEPRARWRGWSVRAGGSARGKAELRAECLGQKPSEFRRPRGRWASAELE